MSEQDLSEQRKPARFTPVEAMLSLVFFSIFSAFLYGLYAHAPAQAAEPAAIVRQSPSPAEAVELKVSTWNESGIAQRRMRWTRPEFTAAAWAPAARPRAARDAPAGS